MRYLKAVLVGIVAALLASVIYVIVVFALPIAFPFLLSRMLGAGAMGGGASFSDAPVLAIAIIAFAVGFYWEVRKARVR